MNPRITRVVRGFPRITIIYACKQCRNQLIVHSFDQARIFEGWPLHALSEIAFRYLLIALTRWHTGQHGEKKHQLAKKLFLNTNGLPEQKCKQIMVGEQRRAAALHVILGGWWLAEKDGAVQWVRAGPSLRKCAKEQDTVIAQFIEAMSPASRFVQQMAPGYLVYLLFTYLFCLFIYLFIYLFIIYYLFYLFIIYLFTYLFFYLFICM